MSDEKTNDSHSEHTYDGIIEHDHPLPQWWVLLFYATIVFAIGYYSYYELLGGPSSDQELHAELEKLEGLQKEVAGNAGNDLEKRINDQEFIQIGGKVFSEKCFMCHGDKGQGTIGPNLTDKFWIHGGKPEEILKIMQVGVPDKGMPPWAAALSSDEQVAVTVFIVSLKNSNPPNPKPPQGDKIVE